MITAAAARTRYQRSNIGLHIANNLGGVSAVSALTPRHNLSVATFRSVNFIERRSVNTWIMKSATKCDKGHRSSELVTDRKEQ
jgi:hypothetical protein